jgi:uncharacterized membrane protein YcaP (DUF421 family)
MRLEDIWGVDEHLNMLQMSARAFCMFFITLALIRVGGMRIFGLKSAFDSVMVIMLGAILARGVVGASPFFSTVAAGVVFAVIHRVLGLLSLKNKWVGKIVKGQHHTLYRDGKFYYSKMQWVSISKDDLMEAVRTQLNKNDLENVQEIIIEKSGELSVVEKAV